MIKPFKIWNPCAYFFKQDTWYAGPHLGQDFDIYYQPVYAHTDYEKYRSGFGNKIGNFVIIKDVNGKYVRHGHLSQTRVQASGKQGDIIGITGSTGLSKAPHAHTDVWTVPFDEGYKRVLDGDYSVVIDPLEYFIDSNKTTMEKLTEMVNYAIAHPRAFIVVVNDAKGEKWFIKDDKKEKIVRPEGLEEAGYSAHPQRLFVSWGMIANLPEAKLLTKN